MLFLIVYLTVISQYSQNNKTVNLHLCLQLQKCPNHLLLSCFGCARYDELIRISKSQTIRKGDKLASLLVEHDIEHAAEGQLKLHSIDIEVIPVVALLVLVVEFFVTCADRIRGNVSVEVVDMVVFDPVGEGPKQEGYLQEGAAFQGGFSEISLALPSAVGHID
jgi:hypothetical protein